MFDLTGKKIIIIGGSSGIGLSIAKACLSQGAQLVIASRNLDKLNNSKKDLNPETEIHSLDISQPDQIQNFFQKVGKFDHLITPAATVSWGTFGAMNKREEQASFQNKFWGQYYAAKFGFPYLNTGGSIVFFAGCWSQRPIAGAAIPSSINGAIESLGRSLAVELAPLRVNVISPGIIDTPVFSGLSEQDRKAFFDKTAKGTPIKKIGNPQEVAMAAIYLMTNTFTTGSTIFVDGGETLR